MQTLLIFDEIPESQLRILLPDAPDWLPQVDGLFINGSGMTEEQDALMQRVADALSRKSDYCADPNDPLACQWRQHELPACAIIDGPVQVVHCGFIM